MVAELVFTLYLISMYVVSVISLFGRERKNIILLSVCTFVSSILCIACLYALIFLDLHLSPVFSLVSGITYFSAVYYTQYRVHEYFRLCRIKQELEFNIDKLEQGLNLVDNAIVVGKGKLSKSLKGTEDYLLFMSVKASMFKDFHSLCVGDKHYDIDFYAGFEQLVEDTRAFADTMLETLVSEENLDALKAKFSIFVESIRLISNSLMEVSRNGVQLQRQVSDNK